MRWALDANTVAGSAGGTYGAGSASLHYSLGIQVVDNTTLYIVDCYNHRVVVIQPGSTNATFILGSGAGPISSQFNQPSDIFVTSTSVYVLDTMNYRVQRWSRNGVNGTTVAGITGSAGTAAGNNTFGASYGIYLGKYGYLYVSDQATHRVLRFPLGSTSGTSAVVVAGTGVAGSGPSQLNSPYKAFVDDGLTMYIADTGNHRIQRWSYGACSGVTVAGTGVAGSALNQLSNPSLVIVDASGFMYISDSNNHRILRWSVGSCSGECIAACAGGAGTTTTTLNNPFSLAFDSNGWLYVSDRLNHRVQKFSLLGGFGEYQTMELSVLNVVLIRCMHDRTSQLIVQSYIPERPLDGKNILSHI